MCMLWLFRTRSVCNESEPLWSGGNWLRPALAVGTMVVYATLMEDMGYVLSTLLFLISWQVLIEREKWRKTAIIAIIGTVSMYIIFVYFLKVSLPEGILGI